MSLFRRHLDAATLGLAGLGDSAGPRADAHLASCPRCRRERDRIGAMLDDARAGADAAVDAAFGPVALERQRHAIVQRCTRIGVVARVLPFPHGPDDRSAPAPRPDVRWLIVAAAAGLLLGVAVGHVPDLLNAQRETPGVAQAVAPATPAPAADWHIDDMLLSEVDAALESDTRPELEALDALTPVHYETR